MKTTFDDLAAPPQSPKLSAKAAKSLIKNSPHQGRRAQSEAILNQRAVEAINRIPSTFVRKRTADYNNVGMADITGTSHGYTIELEGKLPGEHPTALQEQWLKRCASVGSIYGCFHSESEAVEIVIRGLAARGLTVVCERPGRRR